MVCFAAGLVHAREGKCVIADAVCVIECKKFPASSMMRAIVNSASWPETSSVYPEFDRRVGVATPASARNRKHSDAILLNLSFSSLSTMG